MKNYHNAPHKPDDKCIGCCGVQHEAFTTSELIERLRSACLGGGAIPDTACSCVTHEAARLIERLQNKWATFVKEQF